jgi:hypothetical protein
VLATPLCYLWCNSFIPNELIDCLFLATYLTQR